MDRKFEYVNGAEMGTALVTVIKGMQDLCYYDLQILQDICVAYGKQAGDDEKMVWDALLELSQKEICKK